MIVGYGQKEIIRKRKREKDSNKKKNIQLNVRVKQGKGGKGGGGVQRNNLIPREREQRDRSDYSTRQTRLGVREIGWIIIIT